MPYKTKEERHAYYIANKEKSLLQSREWKKRNRNKARASYTKWAKKNPDKVKSNRKAYYDNNREAALAYSAKFRADNPELVKENLARWKRENPEKVSAILQKRRTAKAKSGGAYTYEQWIALCGKYGNKCLCCDKKKKLTPDHVFPVSKGGTSDISNIQPLCGPCNSSKGAKTVDYRREINNAGHSSRSNRRRG
jgi:5-methylcytosine-specific restriction endonuclease McrA